jgi:hypothetical protein
MVDVATLKGPDTEPIALDVRGCVPGLAVVRAAIQVGRVYCGIACAAGLQTYLQMHARFSETSVADAEVTSKSENSNRKPNATSLFYGATVQLRGHSDL